MRVSSIAALLWCSVVVAPAAHAQDARDRAVVLAERAEARFVAGEFDRAALLLEEAIELVDSPTLHYNLARALFEDGALVRAREQYETYLAMEPESSRRAEVLARMGQIDSELRTREALAAAEAARAEAAADPMVESPPDDREPSLGPWVLLATAAAPLVLGIVGSVLFLDEVNLARLASSQASAAPHVTSADTWGLLANISYGLAGAMGLASVIWLVVDLTSAERVLEVRAGPTSLTLSGSF